MALFKKKEKTKEETAVAVELPKTKKQLKSALMSLGILGISTGMSLITTDRYIPGGISVAIGLVCIFIIDRIDTKK